MNAERFQAITQRYATLRVAILGDFCLDRYLEIDPAREEISIETGLPVHNVVRVRSQPGGAGTILNNLIALGVGRVSPVGFCGTDGEGFELQRALRARGPAVPMDHFFATEARRTFTYCKPLVLAPGQAPVELSRLDSKNWSPTPPAVEERLMASLRKLAASVDALIVLDQVDQAGTGVLTPQVLEALGESVVAEPGLLIIADSRRGLRDFPPVTFKMNRAEFTALTGTASDASLETICQRAAQLAKERGQSVFVTLAEHGLVGAAPDGSVEHSPALPVRGPIDIVGAGDAVTANLAAALAAGGSLRESLELAAAAASVVIHQLGTTGTASVRQLAELLGQAKETPAE